MGKKRRHSSPEPSELSYKKTALDCSVTSNSQLSPSNSETSTSSCSRHHRRTKKEKKIKHKESRQGEHDKRKHKKKKLKKHRSKKHKDLVGPQPSATKVEISASNKEERLTTPATSAATPTRQVRAPMTKAEWEKQQSIIRRVHDPTTGRDRLVKGDGEILEEIVTKERHKEVNKKATLGDGLYYQSQMQYFS